MNALNCKRKRTLLTEKAKKVKRESDRNRCKESVNRQVSHDGEHFVSQFDLCIKALKRRGVNFTQCPADYY